MKENQVKIFAAHLLGETYFTGCSFQTPTAFLIGNEGNGLSKELTEMADSLVKIPMEGKLESLNAAVAAALLIYEAKRQRS
jgi:TrmH family RNA methyltransferase